MRLTSDINNATENPSETDKDCGTAEIDLDVVIKRDKYEQKLYEDIDQNPPENFGINFAKS
jgi:hypothetical protein